MIINAILLNQNHFFGTIAKLNLVGIVNNQILLVLICFGIVLFALTLIYLLIRVLRKGMDSKSNNKSDISKVKNEAEKPKMAVLSEKENEVNAAIAMALHLYLDTSHYEESLVITMDLRDRIDTQWNSNIHYLN